MLGGLDSDGRITEYMHAYNYRKDKWKIFGELPRPLKSKAELSGPSHSLILFLITVFDSKVTIRQVSGLKLNQNCTFFFTRKCLVIVICLFVAVLTFAFH